MNLYTDIDAVLSGDRRWAVAVGDCRDVLRSMPDGCARCCVTSPPYWGLRDYGTATWEGGDPACDHKTGRNARNDGCRNSVDGFGGNRNIEGHANMGALFFSGVCRKCGAIRIDAQLGLEPTPAEYVAGMVEVFREVRRVLADDGTCWVNLGDSYASDSKGSGGASNKQDSNKGSRYETKKLDHGVKAKDLCGIPWRVAFALQADGWYLRQDIIWAKPNPMPESVTDRCTKSHEYIFLLAKRARYYYDHEAIAEKAAYAGQGRGGSTNRYEQNAAGMDNVQYDTRNKWSVWTVNPATFKGAHFATYPPKLIEPCILAGSAVGDVVIDPFNGAGTTGVVSVKHGRRYVGAELNPEYAAMASRRITEADTHLFAGGAA